MNGPHKSGTFKSDCLPSELAWETQFLKRGRTYTVTKWFVDADNDAHAVGEEWTFIASMFSRFDDELTLCVRFATCEEWTIPLLWNTDSQADVIENFSGYVCEVSSRV
ncbi:MAG: hypothetical protein O2931_13135 [Planctomycetota bacterium]|nr:hypothetical protein [Planctomycetota bacterium]MDA1179728.1 hypothetical protein [Planctomycetota bacterium]